MSCAGDLDIEASTRSAVCLSVVPAPREQSDSGDWRPRAGAWGVVSLPLAGAFEIICRDCGDHPSLDYSGIPPWLQRIRGPYSLEAGLAAYAEHLGLVPRQHEAEPGESGKEAGPDQSGNPEIRASVRSPAYRTANVVAREQRETRARWLRAGAGRVVTAPAAGQPGHGRAVSLRPQSVWSARDGVARRTGAFEVICCDCGDHPYLEYSVIPPRLQQIRGPYTLEAGIAAYARHLGLAPRLREASPGGAAADAVTTRTA